MNPRFLVLPALLIVAASVGASVLILALNVGEIIPYGIFHNYLYISGSTGAPELETLYYFTAGGVSTISGEAVAISEVKKDGALLYSPISEEGDCTWSAAINGGEYKVADGLNGMPVETDDVIKWAVMPNISTETYCRKEFDLNVVRLA